MNSIIISHIVYLTISIGMTVWVGRTLFTNGQIFINDAFHGNEEMGNKRHSEMLNLQAKVQQSLIEIQQQLKTARPETLPEDPARPRLRPSSSHKTSIVLKERPRSSIQHSKSAKKPVTP